MKSPSIAQRGEGGVRGGSEELDPTVQTNQQAQRDASFPGLRSSAEMAAKYGP